MQFNSVQSGSFLTGAKSVAQNATDIYNTAIQTGFDAEQVIKQSNANESVKKMANARRQASMANAGLSNFTDAKITEMDAKLKKDLRDIKRPAVRMEGINRMAGSVAAGAYIMDESKKLQKEQAANKVEESKLRQAQIEAFEAMKKRAEEGFVTQEGQIKRDESELVLPPGMPSVNPTDQPKTPQKVSTAGQPDITSLNTSTYTGSLDSLSPEDKKWIAFAVSGEAKRGTDDEFGVASVIQTRMKNRGQTAKEVVFAPGQFAAVVGTPGLHGPTARHEPGLVNRLFSPEGMAKIEEATKKLDGRAYFKGQTMLKYRSSKGNKDYDGDGKPDMDPMLHPLGNFYHRGDQG